MINPDKSKLNQGQSFARGSKTMKLENRPCETVKIRNWRVFRAFLKVPSLHNANYQAAKHALEISVQSGSSAHVPAMGLESAQGKAIGRIELH